MCKMIHLAVVGILFSMQPFFMYAQDEEYVPIEARNDDYTYRPNIRTVRLYPNDSEVDYPIIPLGSSTQLVLEFDDLDAYTKNYYYKFIHCNADWTPSTIISPIDYIDGFQENRIYDGRNSFNTITEYIHYELRFPNDDVKFKKSGNYLMKVYLNNDEEDLVITKRFMVTENKMKVYAQMRRSATPPYSATHQEMRFSVQHVGISIANPYDDVKIAVLQNGRWDNAVTGLTPTFVNREELIYDIQGKLMFAGMREFRPLDLRSFRARSQQMSSVRSSRTEFNIELFEDFQRQNAAYIYISDLNGKFIIQSFDFKDSKLQGEYGKTHFYLNIDEFPDADVYLVGGFTDWQIYPRFKLTYNEQIDSYETIIPLKNGYYNYYYVVVPRTKDAKPDFMRIEGSSFEAENDYQFFVYYRPYGGRYDQLMTVQKLNSRP